VADHQFEDPSLAALYDGFCAWDRRDDLAFYLPFVMDASAVLDVGCGTGMLLKRARAEGHGGRLVGLDPARGMLDVAQQSRDVEWVRGDLSTVAFAAEFDLAVMSGHAFQVLLSDAAVGSALAAVRRALRPGGRFAFETRNPLVRTWEQWTPSHAETVDGIRMAHRVTAVDGEFVTFTTTYTGPGWTDASESTLRFLSHEDLARVLAAAGFAVEAQYGDWDASPFTLASPEIITIAVNESHTSAVSA
jgi:ubiquinone/menaquinone biosynthesis C-methylase UbiE